MTTIETTVGLMAKAAREAVAGAEGSGEFD